MDVAKIRITAEGVTDDATNKLKTLDKQVETTGKSTDNFKDSFMAAGKTLLGITGTIAAVGIALKGVYDIGKEGAIIAQTAEGFERLESTLPTNVDLLQQLRDAAGGTVDDMTLMSSTLTLVAGASGELQDSLLTATPQLMEIAKAANKLNPTLGDTAFLYESIATGIKRGSPLILDNLGLTISITDVQEKYAASLGKTADQLTETEKQQALLNGVMESGATLIEQAGGAAGGAVDPYTKLEAQTKNLKDSAKELNQDGLKPAIQFLADYVEGMNDATGQTQVLRAALDAGILSMEDYGSLTNAARFATEYYDEQVRLLELRLELLNSEAPKTLDFFEMYSPLVDEATQATEREAQATEAAATASKEHQNALEEQAAALQSVIDKLYQGGDASDEFANRMNAAKYNIAVNRDELNNLGDTVDRLFGEGLITAEDVVSANAFIGIDAVMQELEGGIITAREAQSSLREDFGLTWGEAQEYITGSRDSLQELATLMAEGLGLSSVEDVIAAVEDLGDAFESPKEQAQFVLDLLNLINGKDVSATVKLNIQGQRQVQDLLGGFGVDTSATNYTSEAVGGSGIVSEPTMFLAGEAGVPERYSFEPLGSNSGGSSLDTDRIINELRRLAVDIGTETANALIVAEGA